MKTVNKVVVRNGQIVGAELAVQFFYDQKHKEVVAECPSLLIATSGKDLSHAKEMFKEACELWIETVNKDFNAREELENMGWKFIENEATVTPRKESWNLPFLMNNLFKLNIPSSAWAN
jgi:predicted RNase H-like HicB family nuclease